VGNGRTGNLLLIRGNTRSRAYFSTGNLSGVARRYVVDALALLRAPIAGTSAKVPRHIAQRSSLGDAASWRAIAEIAFGRVFLVGGSRINPQRRHSA
jgi:hypothetical protein